jgi:hypothetical protein
VPLRGTIELIIASYLSQQDGRSTGCSLSTDVWWDGKTRHFVMFNLDYTPKPPGGGGGFKKTLVGTVVVTVC